MIPVVLVAIVVGALLVRTRWRRSTSSRRETANVAMQLARSVRTGAALPQAVVHTTPLVTGPGAAAFATVSRALQRGVPVDEALAEWGRESQGRRGPAEDVELVVAAARFGTRHGGDVAGALESAALTLLDRAELAEETASLSSQSRASVAVLCALPLLGAAMLAAVDRQVAGVLFGTPLGWACLAVAGVLDSLAVVLSELLVRRALR